MLTGTLLNTFLGGITGYITNDIAIKMLFKKYFGFGGVIEETKDEFIENISQLIERDLINHHTLLPEIEKEPFKKAVFEVVKDMITIYLPRNSGDMKLKDISENTKENLINFIEDTKKPIIFQTKNLYLNKPLNSIISNEQFEYISANATDFIYEKNYQNSIFNTIFEILYNKKVDDILSYKVLNQIEENLKNIIKKTDFKKFDSDIENYANEILEMLDIDMLISNVENSINSLKLSEVINTKENLSKEILNKIINIVIKNPQIIEKFSDSLILSLKNVNLTLYDILSKNSISKIEDFLERHFPLILSQVIELIEKNREEIENIINQTIKEHFSNKGSLGQMVVSLVDVFIKNISDKFGIIGQIVSKIEEFGDEAPQIISKQILEFIKTNSISEIIITLQEKGLLDSKIVSDMIIHNIKSLEFQDNIDFLEEFFDKRIGEIYKIDLSFIKTKSIPLILEKIKKENLLKNEINSNLENFIKEFKSSNLNQYFKYLNFEITHSQIDNYFKSQKNVLEKKIGDFVEINDDFNYQNYIDLLFEKDLNTIYRNFSNKHSYDEITKNSIAVLKLNLSNLLTGNVSVSVSKELSKYESHQIKEMVENFMGKELKPINYFGAGLGAIAGAGYYLVSSSLGNPYLHYATPFIYGFTGVLTNHIAIKMLFAPYEEKKILGMKVPFTPGVVARNKPNFAKNISLFVKNDILSDDSLKGIFQNSKESINTLLKEKISHNDYQVFDTLLREDEILEKLSNKTFEAGIEFIENNSELITEKIITLIESIDLKEHKSTLKEKIKKEIISLNYGEKFQVVIDEFIQNNKNLLEYKEYLFLLVDSFIEQIVDKFLDFLSFENVERIILNYEKNYDEFIQNDLKSLVNVNIQKNISMKISDKILSFVRDADTISFIDKVLPKDKKLKELFDGKLVNLVESNLDYMLKNMLVSVQSQRDEIISNIELPFLAKMVISDDDIKTIIDKLLYNKFPDFVEEKKYEINEILINLLEYKVGEIGLGIDKKEVINMFDNVTNMPIFRTSLDTISNTFVSSIMEFKLEEILEVLNIKSLRDVLELFEIQLRNFIMLTKEQIKTNKNNIIKVSKTDFKKILEDILRKNSLNEIFENVNFENDISHISNKILNDEKFKITLESILEEVLDNLLNHDIYNKNQLRNDISNFIKISLKDDKNELKLILEGYLKELFLKLNSIIDIKTKDKLVEKLIEAFLSSIENNLNLVISSINLQDIIEKEINEMSAKEIEELFNSFAGRYFKQLKIYGAIGFVFGLPSLV